MNPGVKLKVRCLVIVRMAVLMVAVGLKERKSRRWGTQIRQTFGILLRLICMTISIGASDVERRQLYAMFLKVLVVFRNTVSHVSVPNFLLCEYGNIWYTISRKTHWRRCL